MPANDLRLLTNSFLAVRLLALREIPCIEDQGSGPFLVVQRALDPELPVVEPIDFLLTREGAWVPVEAFDGLDWDAGRALAFHPSAADVMTLLQTLPSRPRVQRSVEAEPPESTTGADATGGGEAGDTFYAAVLRAVRARVEVDPGGGPQALGSGDRTVESS